MTFSSKIDAPASAAGDSTEGAGASNPLTDLCADPRINLMGQALDAIRDDLAAKLATYNAIRARRGFAPIANVRDVA